MGGDGDLGAVVDGDSGCGVLLCGSLLEEALVRARVVEDRRFGERLLIWRLGNGLRVGLVPRRGWAEKFGLFAVRFGSIDTKFRVGERTFRVPAGTAHLLEHLLFEQTDKPLSEQLAALSIDSNAFTTHTSTAVEISTSGDILAGLAPLAEALINFRLDRGRLEAEKSVVLSELRLSEESPDWLLMMRMLSALYRRHPVRHDIVGTPDSIRRITPDHLQVAYNAFYHPRNAVICFAGDIDEGDFIKAVSDTFGRWRAPTRVGLLLREPDGGAPERTPIYITAPMKRQKFAIAYKDMPPRTPKPLIRRTLVAEIALTALIGSSTENYQRLYEKGVIDGSFGAGYMADESFGHANLAGDSDDAEASAREVVDVLEEAALVGVDEDVFRRLHRRAIGVYIRRLDSPSFVATALATGLFYRHFYTQTLRLLESITRKEVERFARQLFVPSKRVVVILRSS